MKNSWCNPTLWFFSIFWHCVSHRALGVLEAHIDDTVSVQSWIGDHDFSVRCASKPVFTVVGSKKSSHSYDMRGCGIRTRGALLVHSWCTRGALMVPSWCHRGALVVPSWCTRGAIVVHSWCTRGAIVVQSWCHRGALVVHWNHRNEGGLTAPRVPLFTTFWFFSIFFRFFSVKILIFF